MIRRHLVFIVLLCLVATARFAILFLSQTHVMSDEAIVGLMAKHILEGRYLPFYLYGVPYSGSGAWEAYLAVIPFAIFGVGVIALKSSTIVLSLVCLVVFYVMVGRLYNFRVATLASLILALWPALLKWHYQPKGYAFYFISIPVLVLLFLVLEARETHSTKNTFLFGLGAGVSVWCLELILPIVATLGALLILRRKLPPRQLAICAVGFVLGYAPAVCWNFTHAFANWHFLFYEKPEAAGLAERLGSSAWRDIFLIEMPKFFGPDTVLWYYPETPWSGYVMYAIALLAIIMAGRRALRWRQIRNTLEAGFTANETNKDLLMLVLIGACFVPYVIAPLRVPGYFLAGCFFFSILIARLIGRGLARPDRLPRLAGAAVLLAVVVCSIDAMIQMATHNQIETLTSCHGQQDYCMTPVPGADIEAVEEDLKRNRIGSVWTTISFVYPLIFESGERLIASESIFGIDRAVYPPEIPKSEPNNQERSTFVIESGSPHRAEIERACEQKGGVPPRVTAHGSLTVIEERLAVRGP